ncbi:MAG: hypothetical protein ACKO3B_07510, partial [Bacteroidota bacterium]
MKRFLPLIFLFSGMFASMAQQRPAWVPVPAGAGILPNKAAQRSGFPAEFKLFQLDLAPLRQAMMSVAGNNRSALRTVISLPTAAGKFEDFEIIESSNFHPDLQARFPNIRAYSG